MTSHLVHDHRPPSGLSVVLDIGGDVGALLVHLASIPPGGELEARPLGDDTRRFHTGVHPRPSDGGEVLVAIFPEVLEGDYELLDVKGAADARCVARFTIRGGELTELDLR